MIRAEDIVEIGSFHKPHGIKGELSAGFDYDIEPDSLRCVIIEIDGIFVPFFIESWRSRGPGRYLIKLEGVDDEAAAADFSNHTVYAVADEVNLPEDDEEGFYLYDLIGFSVYDNENPIGTIDKIDDTTENILFHVLTDSGKTVFIPFVDEWIQEYDFEDKTIRMSLPEGIINLN